MRAILPCLIILSLAACGGASAPKGAGLGPIGDTAQTSNNAVTRQVTYGTSYDRQNDVEGRAAGLYQTSKGVPWVVYASSSVERGRAPLQGVLARRSAVRYMSSKWKSPYATRVETADGSAMMRIVSVDAITFVVMKKIRAKAWMTSMVSNEPYFKMMDQGIAYAGCTKTGETSVVVGQYGPQNITAPVKC